MANKTILDLVEAISPSFALNFVEIDGPGGSLKLPLSGLIGENVVLVNSPGDLPAPAAGIITLSVNTSYILGNNITLSDRILFSQGSVMGGISASGSVITYTGTGTLFTSIDVSCSIRELGVNAASGAVFSLDGTGNAGAIVTVNNVDVNTCLSLGVIQNITFILSACILIHDDGFDFLGTGLSVIMDDFLFQDTGSGAKALDLGTAIFNGLALTRGTFRGTGTAIEGETGSANIAAGSLSNIRLVGFNLITTPLVGVARDDFRWNFQVCVGVFNTLRISEMALTTTTEITINTQGVPERVATANWSATLEESFTVSSDGETTYIGELDRVFQITFNSAVTKIGGGSDLIEVTIAIDDGGGGGYIQQAKTTGSTDSTAFATAVASGIFLLQEGDKVAPFVTNQGSVSNANFNVANLQIISA